MSLLRDRLGRFWRRSDTEVITNGDERDSMSSEDSGYFSKRPSTTLRSSSLSNTIDEKCPRSLHKAASSTFQPFFDLIKSKNRILYANQDKLEPAASISIKDKSPRANDSRSKMCLLLGSRRSFGNSVDLRSLYQNPPSPMSLRTMSRGKTPVIDVKIPSSSLLDSEPLKDELKASILCASDLLVIQKDYELSKARRSPIKDAVQLIVQPIMMSSNVSEVSLPNRSHIGRPYRTLQSSVLLGPLATDMLQHQTYDSEDPDRIQETKRNVHRSRESQNSLCDPSLTTPTIPYLSKITPRAHHSNSLFFKGGPAGVQLPKDGFKSFNKMKSHSQDRSLVRLGTNFSQSHVPDESKGITTPVRSGQLPCFHRTTSLKSGLKDLFVSCTDVMKPEIYAENWRLPSNIYDANIESAAPMLENPSMGSRHEWERIRADRDTRYLAIQKMNEDTPSEDGSESGLELRRSTAKMVAYGMAKQPLDFTCKGKGGSSSNFNLNPLNAGIQRSEAAVHRNFSADDSTRSFDSLLTRALVLSVEDEKIDTLGQENFAKANRTAIAFQATQPEQGFTATNLGEYGGDIYTNYCGIHQPSKLNPFNGLDQETLEISKNTQYAQLEGVAERLGNGEPWNRLYQMDESRISKVLSIDAHCASPDCEEGLLTIESSSLETESPDRSPLPPYPGIHNIPSLVTYDSGIIANSPYSIHKLVDWLHLYAREKRVEAQSKSPQAIVKFPESNIFDPESRFSEGYAIPNNILEISGQIRQESVINPSDLKLGAFVDINCTAPLLYEADNLNRAFNAAMLPHFKWHCGEILHLLIQDEAKPSNPSWMKIQGEYSKKIRDPKNSNDNIRPIINKNELDCNRNVHEIRSEDSLHSTGKKGVSWARDVEFIEESSRL